jgi:hypothetical protein
LITAKTKVIKSPEEILHNNVLIHNR